MDTNPKSIIAISMCKPLARGRFKPMLMAGILITSVITVSSSYADEKEYRSQYPNPIQIKEINKQIDEGYRQPIRGIIIAAKKAEISVGLSARLKSISFEMGDGFNKGDLLIEFDCSQLQAQHSAVKAAHHSLSLVQKNNEELLSYGAGGALEVETAKADAERAMAEVTAKTVEMKECKIYAPYAGYVIERYVDPFEVPPSGTPLLSIIDDAPLEIQLIAPSKWLRWLSIDTPFSFIVDETGKTYDAKVIRIGKSVDSVSQTINVVAQFANAEVSAIAGMSGTASFSGKSGS